MNKIRSVVGFNPISVATFLFVLVMGLGIQENIEANDKIAGCVTACVDSVGSFVKRHPKKFIALGVLGGTAATACGAYIGYRSGPEIVAKYSFWKNDEFRLLGFDPKYKGLPTGKNDKTPRVIFLCGWDGRDKNPIQELEKLTGDKVKVVTFDFGNANGWPIRSESVGGSYDAQAALFAVIKCLENGCPVTIVGLSRGGATAVTLLHMIEFPNKYKSIWRKFGVTKGFWGALDYEKISKIKNSIKKTYINNSYFGLCSVLCVSKRANTMIKLAIMPFTKFDFYEPLDRLKDLSGKGWNLEVGVKIDDFVGNLHDKTLQNLCEQNTSWSFHDKNKRHLDYSKSIASIARECMVKSTGV